MISVKTEWRNWLLADYTLQSAAFTLLYAPTLLDHINAFVCVGLRRSAAKQRAGLEFKDNRCASSTSRDRGPQEYSDRDHPMSSHAAYYRALFAEGSGYPVFSNESTCCFNFHYGLPLNDHLITSTITINIPNAKEAVSLGYGRITK